MATKEGRLSGKRGNRLVQEMVSMYDEMVETYVTKFIEDGYPMGAEPTEPRVQYERLLMWRNSGDPRFWESPAAQAAFANLELRFGGAAPMSAPPPLIG